MWSVFVYIWSDENIYFGADIIIVSKRAVRMFVFCWLFYFLIDLI